MCGTWPKGHLLACERGRPGERYILGSENLTLAQILQKLAAHHRAQGAHRAPALRGGLLRRRVQHGLGALTGKPPRVPLDAVRMARKKMWVTHEKARRELGFEPGPGGSGPGARRRWFQAAAIDAA